MNTCCTQRCSCTLPCEFDGEWRCLPATESPRPGLQAKMPGMHSGLSNTEHFRSISRLVARLTGLHAATRRATRVRAVLLALVCELSELCLT